MHKIKASVMLAALVAAVCLFLLLFTACTGSQTAKSTEKPKETQTGATQVNAQNTNYQQITQSAAKAIMDSGSAYILLDVRTGEEFESGHIPNAVCLPYEEIPAQAETQLPDKNALILVYCRSGRRSKIAAQTLSDMGYTDVREFGGILDWPYETVR